MVRYENDCCDCATESYPCRGKACPLRNVPHYYCDKCGKEEALYEYGDEELCADCLLEKFEKVEGSY
jgi:hypothetical protein